MKERAKRSAPARERHDTLSSSRQADVDVPQIGEAAAQEQIRLRAYELYCARDGRSGDDVADWLQAESEYVERLGGDDAIKENPPRTTTGGWFTAPKFGSAGSGGAELDPGPERD